MSLKVVKGWVFYSADFSAVAQGTSSMGKVTIERCNNDRQRWHRIVQNIDDEKDWPELFVTEYGTTLEKALEKANKKAKTIEPLPGGVA